MPEEEPKKLIACLSDFSVEGIWYAEFKDKSTARKLEQDAEVAENTARVKWDLFPEKTCGKQNAYTKWRSAYGRVYTYHRKNTWPWRSPLRLVRGSFHEEYDKVMNGMIAEMDKAFEEFIKGYEALQELARVAFNGKWEAVKDQYPAKLKLEGHYSHRLGYLPLSTQEHFCKEIAGAAIEHAKAEMQAGIDRLVADGKKFAIMELIGPVQNMADMLSKDKPIIKESLIENCKDACNRIKALNITDDPQIEAAKSEILSMLTGIDGDSLRNSASMRQVVSAQALAVAQRFGGLGIRKFDKAA